ncbi:MAG TPA: glycosyltransferase [Anaerolineales bacterium]|nr:glycosyltransferase [Anaerolineales bacterium]
MRIGMLVDAYKPYVSGITNYVALSKRFLEKAGQEVFVFAFGGDDYVDEELNIIRTRGLLLVDSGYYFSVRYNLHAQRILRTMDLVHVHHPFVSGRLALRYCQPRGIPIVFTNHTRYDLYTQAYLPMIPDVVGDTFLRAYMPSFCKSCDLVIAPSPGLREVLRGLGVESLIEVIPNGVDLAPFQAGPEAVSRADLGFSDKDVVLTYTGRLGPEKNLAFLLRAYAGTARAYENVGLMIIGDGPERDNLEALVRMMGIADRVHFTGVVAYEEIPRYLVAADAFVTASVTEVHPLSVIEAMAAGLPVLGIRSPGVSDTVEDGVSGLIAQEEDLAEFTAKMVRLVTDQEARKKMRVQAIQVAGAYAIERTTNLILEQYQRIVEAASGRKRGMRLRVTHLVDKILS